MSTMTRPTRPVKPRKPRAVRPTTGTCGLTLRITARGETARYGVTPLPIDDPATFGVLRGFRLRKLGKSPGQALAALYDVVQHLDGSCECDCASHVYGLDGGTCKHVSALVSLGLLARKGGAR